MPAPTPRGQVPDDRAAFEQLALPLLPALHRTARRLAQPPDDATDLVQETCLRAYRTFAGFEPGTNAKAWLFTILYSVAVNAAERRRRRPELAVDDVEERFAQVVAAGDEELALVRRIDASPEVDAALARLPEEFRSVVVLVDVEQLTYDEASTVLGCPVGTVRSRLSRGRKRLFLELHEYARRQGFVKGGGA